MAIIHKNWVHEDCCLWPPERNQVQSLLKAGATPGPDWQPVPYNAVQAFGNTVVMYLGFHVILGTCLLWISNYIYTKFRLSKSRTLFSGTYEEARQRLRRAEDTSDLQSEVDLGRGKRKKKDKTSVQLRR